MTTPRMIQVRGAEVHNLRCVDLDIPLGKLIAFCGVSGSGKTSLALDTLYAEGQRRYVESFSLYSRQFLERLEKPAVERIENLPAALAVTTDSGTRTSRSTIATATETADYLRLLYARGADLLCPTCRTPVTRFSPQQVLEVLQALPAGLKLQVGFGLVRDPLLSLEDQLAQLKATGFLRLAFEGKTFDLSEQGALLGLFHASLDSATQNDPRAAIVIVDRLTTGPSLGARGLDSLATAFRQVGHALLLVEDAEGLAAHPQLPACTPITLDGRAWQRVGFSSQLRCLGCNREFVSPEPKLFSFNSPLGACHRCEGQGSLLDVDWELVFPDPARSLSNHAIAPWEGSSFKEELEALLTLAPKLGLPVDLPVREFTPEQQQILRYGAAELDWGGIDGFFQSLLSNKQKLPQRTFAAKYKSTRKCPECLGTRLQAEPLAWLLGDKNIAQMSSLPIEEIYSHLSTLPLVDARRQGCQTLLRQVLARLDYLRQVGLGYLPLDRPLNTLSGGEAQRVALTSALGSTLVNMLYVLDEPSSGLHPRDVQKLVTAMLALRDRGNTVIAVEHEETLLRSADYLVEIGPGAGDLGGDVVFTGTLDEMLDAPKSSTGDFLAGRRGVSLPGQRRPTTRGWIKLTGAKGNNLKDLTVSFPLGVLCVVTGVSGAGKSSLVQETLYGALCKRKRKPCDPPLPYTDVVGDGAIDEVILVDQSPVGRSPRSSPATYIKAFDPIRAVFAETIEARTHNYGAGAFSFNVAGGRCEACEGDGFREVDMQFLADVLMKCPACNGSRYRQEILKVTYRGKNIAEVLQMSAREAFGFFRGQPKVQARLKPLMDVGLDYIRLGQPVSTLSAGEAQRLKLAAHLSEVTRSRTVFLMDEPTSGLHFADIVTLLDCFDALLSVGHSLILVEHNLQLIRSADYIIDMGPEAGEDGGTVVVTGTPEEIAACPQSHTGHFLAQVLQRDAELQDALQEASDEDDEVESVE